MSENADQRLVRPLAYVLLVGCFLIWTGLAIEADGPQLIGVAVCGGGFVGMGVVGWRLSRDHSR